MTQHEIKLFHFNIKQDIKKDVGERRKGKIIFKS